MIKKLQVSVLEIANINKRVAVLVSIHFLYLIFTLYSETVRTFLTLRSLLGIDE